MLHLLGKQRAHRPRVNADINNTDIKYHHVTTLIEASEYHKMYPLGTADLVKPKFKEGIKINLHRALEGEPLFATVSRSTTGKYHISITCEVEHKPYGKTGKSVGIDTGIKKLAVLSEGSSYENTRSLKTNLKKLRFGQRQLSKKTKGSG